MKYTNALLTIIAVLLAIIATQQYAHRPVTVGELRELQAKDNQDEWAKRRDKAQVVISPR